MKTTTLFRGRRAPRWIGATALAAVLVLATGCVTDLTDELGEYTYVVGVNRVGDRLVTEYGYLARYGVDGSKFRLGAPPGFKTAYIVGQQPINDQGVTVGMAESTANRDTIPVMWEPDGTVTDLRRYLPHSDCVDLYSRTPSINGKGVVVGTITCGSSLEPAVHENYVFDRSDNSVRYLPAPAQDEGDRGLATDINDDGVVVGIGHTGGARWTRDGDGYRYEHLDLTPLDINNRGDILGYQWVDGGAQPYLLRAGSSVSVPLASSGHEVGIFSDNHLDDQGTIVLTVSVGGSHQTGVRYETAGSAPEVFPGLGGDDAYFEALGEDGAAYGQARNEQGSYRAVRWTHDPDSAPQG